MAGIRDTIFLIPLLVSIDSMGKGYHSKKVIAFNENGIALMAYTYIANADMISPLDIKMYDWCKEHLIEGAREHGLPLDYIETLLSMGSVIDTDSGRRR